MEAADASERFRATITNAVLNRYENGAPANEPTCSATIASMTINLPTAAPQMAHVKQVATFFPAFRKARTE